MPRPSPVPDPLPTPRANVTSRLAPGLTVLAALAFLGTGPASAQITSNTALPIGRGENLVRIQGMFVRSTGDDTGADRELQVGAFPVVALHGATAKLTLFGVFPVLFKNLDLTAGGNRISRDNGGLGDVRVFARYTVYQLNGAGRTLRIAPFAGLELPTGSTGESDEFGKLPMPLQMGSGSWDPYLGIVLTRQTLAWQVDAAMSYLLSTRADGFRAGGQARLDVATKLRLLPRRLRGALPRFVYGNLETNLIWKDQDENGRTIDPNSGGFTWYLAPGVQYVTRRFIVESAIQLPLAQNLKGSGLRNDFIATFSARLNF
jgi:hypothetical protein